MLAFGTEKTKRKVKEIEPDGEWIKLANGETWCFGSMPLAKQEAKFFIDQLAIYEKIGPNVKDFSEFFDIGQQIATRALQLNYEINEEETIGLFRLEHLPKIVAALNCIGFQNKSKQDTDEIRKN